MVSVAVQAPIQTGRKPPVPVKVAAVELNSAERGAVFGHDHPTHAGGVGL
jgi:hypothetical protein